MKHLALLALLLIPLPAFAELRGEPFSTLDQVDRDYYARSFSYAMAAVKDGETHAWKGNGGSGSITPGERFKAPSGVTCRGFAETYVISGQSGNNQGFGCKRDEREGWCKLKEGDMLSCAFEPPDGLIDELTEDTLELYNKTGNRKQRIENTWWWPF